jgi:hypothetical protein
MNRWESHQNQKHVTAAAQTPQQWTMKRIRLMQQQELSTRRCFMGTHTLNRAIAIDHK